MGILSFSGVQGKFFLLIFIVEAEILFSILFAAPMDVVVALVFITIAGFAFYYLSTMLKNYGMIGGHFCLTLQCHYGQNRWEAADALVENVVEYRVPESTIEQFERSDQFLEKFADNIARSRIRLPDKIKNIKNKYLYLELRKRMGIDDLEDLMKTAKDEEDLGTKFTSKLKELTSESVPAPLTVQNKKSEIKTIEEPIQNQANEPETEEKKKKRGRPAKTPINEKPMPDPNQKPNINQEQKEAMEEKTEIIRDPNNVQDPDQDIDQDDQQDMQPPRYQAIFDPELTKKNLIKSFIAIIILIGLIALSLYVIQVPNFTITLLIIGLIDILFLIVNLVRYFREIFNARIEIHDQKTVDEEALNLTVKEIFPIFPYCHFTKVTFKMPYLGFKDCMLVSQSSFFSSFIFTKGPIYHDGYFYNGIVSPAVVEYVGEIEENFPILYAKFNTGMVDKDLSTALSFNLIENCKVSTYYRMMSEARAEGIVKDDRIASLESYSQTMRHYMGLKDQQTLSQRANLAESISAENDVNQQLTQANEAGSDFMPQPQPTSSMNPKIMLGLFAVLIVLVVVFALI